MVGATRSSTGRSHCRRLPRFLFLPHGQEETAGGSGVGGLWLVFWEKVAYAIAAFVCCNVFRTLCFVTPIVVKEEEEDSLFVLKLNFTLTNTLAYRLLFSLRPSVLPHS
jgi:hypothetical protein